jgi:hypothetical protein
MKELTSFTSALAPVIVNYLELIRALGRQYDIECRVCIWWTASWPPTPSTSRKSSRRQSAGLSVGSIPRGRDAEHEGGTHAARHEG